jgi:hypothetical protein
MWNSVASLTRVIFNIPIFFQIKSIIVCKESKILSAEVKAPYSLGLYKIMLLSPKQHGASWHLKLMNGSPQPAISITEMPFHCQGNYLDLTLLLRHTDAPVPVSQGLSGWRSCWRACVTSSRCTHNCCHFTSLQGAMQHGSQCGHLHRNSQAKQTAVLCSRSWVIPCWGRALGQVSARDRQRETRRPSLLLPPWLFGPGSPQAQ